MAKLKCKLVSIYTLGDQLKPVMKRLQEMGVMDIETAGQDEETSKIPEGYLQKDTDARTDIYRRNLSSTEEALKILDTRFKEKKGLLSSFAGLPEIEAEDFYLDKTKAEAARTLVGNIINDDRVIAEQKAEIIRLRTTAEQMKPWENLDVALTFSGTAKTAAFIGTVSGNYTLEELLSAIAETTPELDVYAEIVNADKDNTYLFVCCPVAQRDLAEGALRMLSFARPSQITSKLPSVKIQSKLDRIKKCEEKIEECLKRLEEAASHREELRVFADYCRTLEENSTALSNAVHTKHTSLIRGYVAEIDIPYLKRHLEKDFTVVIEVDDADEKLAPVKLKNNFFAAPAETITTMYSLPSYTDIDPTPLTGFFYYLLFGMMLSDAGYGLLMVIGTLLGLKFLKPGPKMRQTLRMFLYCGISTVIWGAIFGSFFGDSIAVISETFFGKRIALPALLDPMHGDAVTLLIISIAIGFIQIIAGLVAKFVTALKNGDKAGAFFDAGFWITMLLGVGILALGIMAVKPLVKVGAIIAVASALGLVLTQGREKKGIMKIFSGIASLYDITGYVSDLLSFSRLMALGLTTAAMGAVFNLLGTLAGNGIIGIVLMIVMFIVGHALCFALNALGAYVHTLRLQYVELFSKFYEGGGRPFKAFSLKNKYVGVKNAVKEEN